MARRAVISIHARRETGLKLEALARAMHRTRSALVNEALEQYLAHQEWLIREIEKGVSAADRGELVDDEDVESWFRSIGAAD
jgi:predicted transcriptional regulator